MSAAYITVYFYHGSEHYEPPPYFSQREQSDLNFLPPRLKTGVYMRLEIPLEYFCHLYSRLLSFRGRFCFTCLVSSFRSLSLLCFGQRKKVGTTSSLSALFFEENLCN